MVKEIYFDKTWVGYATKATIKDELETEKTPTFSGTLVDGDPNPSVTVSIEALRAGTIAQYIALEQKIKLAKTEPITVQIKATDKGKDQTITELFKYIFFIILFFHGREKYFFIHLGKYFSLFFFKQNLHK